MAPDLHYRQSGKVTTQLSSGWSTIHQEPYE